jgi:hypothetical protein
MWPRRQALRGSTYSMAYSETRRGLAAPTSADPRRNSPSAGNEKQADTVQAYSARAAAGYSILSGAGTLPRNLEASERTLSRPHVIFLWINDDSYLSGNGSMFQINSKKGEMSLQAQAGTIEIEYTISWMSAAQTTRTGPRGPPSGVS